MRHAKSFFDNGNSSIPVKIAVWTFLIITSILLFVFLSLEIDERTGINFIKPAQAFIPKTYDDPKSDVNARLDRIMDHAYPKLSNSKREKYRTSILRWSGKYGLCPVTVASIIWKESKFDEKCRYKGAVGPMQTIPRYHRKRMAAIGVSDGDLCTIDKGVHIGCVVFKHYLDKSHGNVVNALKRYNGCVGAKNPKYVRDILAMRDGSKHRSQSRHKRRIKNG